MMIMMMLVVMISGDRVDDDGDHVDDRGDGNDDDAVIIAVFVAFIIFLILDIIINF